MNKEEKTVIRLKEVYKWKPMRMMISDESKNKIISYQTDNNFKNISIAMDTLISIVLDNNGGLKK